MAKRNKTVEQEVIAKVRTRREELREQRESSQNQLVRRVALGVIGFLALVLIVGLIVEFLVVPRQAVATVGNEEITLAEWQDMVRYQRARLIVGIEEQYELFADPEAEDPEAAEAQAISYIQQFSGQQISLLTNAYQFLGEFVVEQLVEDELVRQGAEMRNLTVSQEEIDAAVGEQFSYFGGGLPTPQPSATASPEPTPSLTPVPTFTPEGFVLTSTETLTGTEVTTDTVAVEPTAEPTLAPTSTPLPTATPVSADSFQEQLTEQNDGLNDLGADEALYLYEVEMSLYREKLADALFAEQEISTNAEHASAFFLLASTEEEANALATQVAEKGFLTVWNELKSNPIISADPAAQPPSAQELLWRTEDDYLGFFPNGTVSEAIFSLPIGEASGVLADSSNGTDLWVILQVSGREERPLSETALEEKKQEILTTWLEEQRAAKVVVFENWRTRVPRQPVLDVRYSQVIPTATPPAAPEVPLP